MFYLLEPGRAMHWVDLPEQMVLDALARGSDLSKVEWLEMEHPRYPTAVEIALALRHGAACPAGVLLPGWCVAVAESPDQIRSTSLAARRAHETIEKADGSFFEQRMPGWTEATRELNERVDEGSAASIDRAERELQELLDAPINDAVHNRWIERGGARNA